MLIKPGLTTDIFGALVLGGVYLYQRWEGKHSAETGISSLPPGKI